MHTGQKVTKKKDKFDDEKFIKITSQRTHATKMKITKILLRFY